MATLIFQFGFPHWSTQRAGMCFTLVQQSCESNSGLHHRQIDDRRIIKTSGAECIRMPLINDEEDRFAVPKRRNIRTGVKKHTYWLPVKSFAIFVPDSNSPNLFRILADKVNFWCNKFSWTWFNFLHQLKWIASGLNFVLAIDF